MFYVVVVFIYIKKINVFGSVECLFLIMNANSNSNRKFQSENINVEIILFFVCFVFLGWIFNIMDLSPKWLRFNWNQWHYIISATIPKRKVKNLHTFKQQKTLFRNALHFLSGQNNNKKKTELMKMRNGNNAIYL